MSKSYILRSVFYSLLSVQPFNFVHVLFVGSSFPVIQVSPSSFVCLSICKLVTSYFSAPELPQSLTLRSLDLLARLHGSVLDVESIESTSCTLERQHVEKADNAIEATSSTSQ